MPTTGEISLYFHIPFCSKKCPYCHFFVLPDRQELKAPYVAALLKEWRLRLPELMGKEIVSIYFGGGTPTKLPPESYAELLREIQKTHALGPECEITLEANPEDVTEPLMRDYHASGINRVSLGVQSLHAPELVVLGRTHSASRAQEAILATHAAGITNLSIDLMFELPGQTVATWEETLRRVPSLPVTHLSLYNLTFEPHTLFFQRERALRATLPNEADRLTMLQRAVAALEACGLQRYEISAFARPGKHSRHNTGYWVGRPFVGFGPSAFSDWGGERFSNHAHYKRYLEALEGDLLPVGFRDVLPQVARLKERLAVWLRLLDGVDVEEFQRRHGPLPEDTVGALAGLVERRWLERVGEGTGERVRLTQEGRLFYDSVAVELI